MAADRVPGDMGAGNGIWAWQILRCREDYLAAWAGRTALPRYEDAPFPVRVQSTRDLAAAHFVPRRCRPGATAFPRRAVHRAADAAAQAPLGLTAGYETVCIARLLDWTGSGMGTPCGVFFSQLRDAQTRQGARVDRTQEAHLPALHPHQRVLGQPCRAVFRHSHAEADSSWCLYIGATLGEMLTRVFAELQRKSTRSGLDKGCRGDRRKSPSGSDGVI